VKVSSDGLALIAREEGIRNEMYHDPIGLPTIGVGHLLTRDELSSGKIRIRDEYVRWGDGLTEDQVLNLLAQDLDPIEQELSDVSEYMEREHGVGLEPTQFDALASFVFNIGLGAFRRSTLRRRLLWGFWEDVVYQIKRWKYAGGRPILEPRREREARLWETGLYV
jgi:lysozyme